MSDTEPSKPLTHAERGQIGGYSSKYTLRQVDEGLKHLVLAAGDATKASQVVGIPESTLKAWRSKQHTDRYQQLRDELEPRIRAHLVADAEDLALTYGAIERQLAERLTQQLDQLQPRDTANALKSLATSRAISTDKVLLLRGQPTEIIQHDVSADIRALVLGGVAEVVEGNAQEVQGTQALSA